MKLKRLLIADDQLGIRLLLSEVFKREGYKIFLAANGIEALQLVKDEQPDCILLDMEMPGMNGDEVLKEIKSNWPDIPVIMMTAHADVELLHQILEDLVQLFTKPFDIYELRDTVNRVFEK